MDDTQPLQEEVTPVFVQPENSKVLFIRGVAIEDVKCGQAIRYDLKTSQVSVLTNE